MLQGKLRSCPWLHECWGYPKQGGELQVLTERQEKGSVIIITNLGFACWPQVIGDPMLQQPILID
jgi:hypothetical protein